MSNAWMRLDSSPDAACSVCLKAEQHGLQPIQPGLNLHLVIAGGRRHNVIGARRSCGGKGLSHEIINDKLDETIGHESLMPLKSLLLTDKVRGLYAS